MGYDIEQDKYPEEKDGRRNKSVRSDKLADLPHTLEIVMN